MFEALQNFYDIANKMRNDCFDVLNRKPICTLRLPERDEFHNYLDITNNETWKISIKLPKYNIPETPKLKKLYQEAETEQEEFYEKYERPEYSTAKKLQEEWTDDSPKPITPEKMPPPPDPSYR